jgi:hypothetical protein
LLGYSCNKLTSDATCQPQHLRPHVWPSPLLWRLR